MSVQRILRHKLFRDPVCQSRLQSALPVQRSQFLHLPGLDGDVLALAKNGELHFVAVQNPQVGRLPRLLRKGGQPAFRLLANIHRPYDKMAAFNQLHAQAVFVVFRILIDIAVQL